MLARYTLGDNILSPSDLIQKKLQAVQNELDAYHPNYLKEAGGRLANELKEERELMDYQRQLYAEQRRINQQIEEAAAAERSRLTGFKNALRSIKNFFLPVGQAFGLMGVAVDTAISAAQGKIAWNWLNYFYKVVAAPLALAAMAAYAIQDMYDTWMDTQREQRMTRYAAGLATLALLGAGIAVMLGVTASILAAPIAMPALLLGMLGVAYAKNHYIHKRAEQDIVTVKENIERKAEALTEAVKAMFDAPSVEFKAILDSGNELAVRKAVNQDPKIQRLVFQINDHRVQLRKLEVQRDHANDNKKGLAGMFFGIGIALLGVIFPPAGVPLAIIGGLIFLASSDLFKQQVPPAKLADLDNAIEGERGMLNERTFVARQCGLQIRSHAKPRTESAAVSTLEASGSQSPVIARPALDSTRPASPPPVVSATVAASLSVAVNDSPRAAVVNVTDAPHVTTSAARSRPASPLTLVTSSAAAMTKLADADQVSPRVFAASIVGAPRVTDSATPSSSPTPPPPPHMSVAESQAVRALLVPDRNDDSIEQYNSPRARRR